MYKKDVKIGLWFLQKPVIVPTLNNMSRTKNTNAVPHFNICHDLFKNPFFSLHHYWIEAH